ncbi:MAG: hypothetical protein KatS3mg061_2829 [Dehalococcoidia bacterium]|nr:MAG: hypothetical protein KatS3mg061_2829 [Dehalococcoidia bacterium]
MVPVDVAVHQEAPEDERLEGPNPFLIEVEPDLPSLGPDPQGSEDPLDVDDAVGNVGEEGIAAQKVEPVHIHCPAHDLEPEAIDAREGGGFPVPGASDQGGHPLRIDPPVVAQDGGQRAAHQRCAYFRMVRQGKWSLDVFQRVREGVVADIVQQRGRNEDAEVRDVRGRKALLAPELEHEQSGEVEHPQGMLEARVVRPRKDPHQRPELADTAQALEDRGIDEGQLLAVERDIPPDRIADPGGRLARPDSAEVGKHASSILLPFSLPLSSATRQPEGRTPLLLAERGVIPYSWSNFLQEGHVRILVLALLGAAFGFLGALLVNLLLAGSTRPEDALLYLAIGAVVGAVVALADRRRLR